eukprot:TRINITY_DN14982_c0_g1_i1.p1 TRINITY_DN14982_c0_g1~~TRINITY_DN14982_c0_g1_i1.p1  ORF type:complete len:426 (+),score=53.82 TRINITY_DN14982_c0_g1_i1:93-1370(+)
MMSLLQTRCIVLSMCWLLSLGALSGGAYNIDLDSPEMLGSFYFGHEGRCSITVLGTENPTDGGKLTFLLMALDAEHAKKAQICSASLNRDPVPGIVWISVNETTEVPTGGGRYELFYVGYPGCPMVEPSSVKVHVEFFSIVDGKKNYLPKGDMPLPTVYLLFSLVYMVMLGLWFRRLNQYRPYLNKVHYLMGVLVVVKLGTMVTDYMKLSEFEKSGTGSAWDFLYYSFLMLKGVMVFALFLLVGAGWSIFRPILSASDRKVFIVVIPIIVIVNVLNIYIEEFHPDHDQLHMVTTVLQITEFISGVLVLVSVTRNTTGIHHQERHAGKRPSSRRRSLQIFALVVVAYLYIKTGLLIILRSLPPHLSFVKPTVTELFVALLFFIVGCTFSPTDKKEFDLSVTNSDDEIEMMVDEPAADSSTPPELDA